MPVQQLHVLIPAPLFKRLKARAEREKRTMTAIVEAALREALKPQRAEVHEGREV